MDDHEAIRQLAVRYNRTFDDRDVKGWIACFTPDGTFEFGDKGRVVAGHEALRAQITNSTNTGRHTVTDFVIDVAGDRATMTCHLTELGTDEGRPVIRAYGRYADTLRRTDDGWRFVSRHLRYG